MKKFKDLEFNIHPWTRTGVHARIDTDKNITISVAAGHGLHSIPGGVDKDEEEFKIDPTEADFSCFEVGIKDKNLPIEKQEWEIFGWQGREQIDEIIKKYSK